MPKNKSFKTFEEKRAAAHKFINKLCPTLHEATALIHVLDAVYSSQTGANEQLNTMISRKIIKSEK